MWVGHLAQLRPLGIVVGDDRLKIFPAIDILAGKCVRLYQGRYDMVTIYAEDPLDMALRWEQEGAKDVHVVDLDGAREGRPVNWKAVERITNRTNLKVELGGGMRTRKDIEKMLSIGVATVVLGTSLVADAEAARGTAAAFSGRVAAGLDSKGGKIAVSGWEKETDVDVVDLARELDTGSFARFIHTDISVDGTQRGVNVASMRRMLEAVEVPVVASGGVGSMSDLEALLALQPLGLEGAIIGRALYEGRISLARAIELCEGSS